MGVHFCKFPHNGLCAFDQGSSGDVTMVFDNGHSYIAPDMLKHYVGDHDYIPPLPFIHDVMNAKLVDGVRWQTKSAGPQPIGYLNPGDDLGTPPTGYEKEKFVLQLMKVMREADRMGNRSQTRGG